MMAFHRLSSAVFDVLAAGGGDTETIGLLRRARLSRTMLFIRHLATNRGDLADAIDAISETQRASPKVAADVLGYPWVSVWAAQSCRRSAPERQLGHLRAVADAALVRSGIRNHPTSAMTNPGVVLPTVGIPGTSELPARPIRRTSCVVNGRQLTILLDDLDPYRDCHGHRAGDRLNKLDWARWNESIIAAWELLGRHAPDRLGELAAGLSSVVPLRPNARRGMSATHGDAFGGFAASLPDHPSQFAVTMVHEFQHSKLNALLDLEPLWEYEDTKLYFVPWRRDPRPLSGALQGLYAFTAVASLWRDLRSEAALERQASLQFAFLRVQVARVAGDLAVSPGLTPAGRRLVAAAGRVIEQLMDCDVSPAIGQLAANDLRSRELAWLARHG